MLQKGFTLIELMIVVAIIGILSMFALPAYQDYTKRTYVSEGFALASSAKLQITESFAANGIWPVDNAAAGMAAADAITGQSIAGIQVLTGTGYTGANTAIKSAADLDAGAAASNILIHYNARVTGSATQDTYLAGDGPGVLTLAPVIFTDTSLQGSIQWVCQKQTIADNAFNGIQTKWLPAACRTEVAG